MIILSIEISEDDTCVRTALDSITMNSTKREHKLADKIFDAVVLALKDHGKGKDCHLIAVRKGRE